MFIDVIRPEAWEELNDKVKTQLGLAPKLRARAYRGLSHAVFEVSQSTAQFMSHKKALGVVLGQTSLFDGLLPYYYKETYEVQTCEHGQLQDVKSWVEGLKKDTNFVLFCEDHPVTGEVYPFAEELDRLLNEKRIFSLRVSHAQHFYRPIEVRPYTVRLNSYTPEVAVAVVGERFRSPATLAPTMGWTEHSFLQELAQACQGKNEDSAQVESFEAEIKPSANLLFKPQADRLFDRAVFYFPDASAEAIANTLFRKLGLSSEDGFKKVTTTNMCHWNSLKMFAHWWQPKPSAEMLRGLLVIDLQLLHTKDFAKQLISSYEEIKQQQSWDV